MDASRVDLMPLTSGTRQHLMLYNDMDISLDPFPYTGTTTTAESLVMGVPVVTLTGGPSSALDSHPSCMSVARMPCPSACWANLKDEMACVPAALHELHSATSNC